MTQKMTDDAKRIMGAFREAPVMTLQAVSTMAGLGEHTTRRERSRCAVGTKMQNGTFCM